MANIIAGHFEQQDQVRHAAAELARAGFAPDRISTFYLTEAGQHATYPAGGDEDRSAGAQESGTGMAEGALAGAAAGLAAVPLLGPVGPAAGALVGAYTGSLVGSMSQMKDAEETPPVRHAGMMAAVEVMGTENEARAIDVLRMAGATDIERANGTIEDGNWRDFDPLSIPAFIDRSGECRL